MKDYRDPETLRHLYHEEKLSMQQIADELDSCYRTIFNWMEKHDIERRPQWQEMDGPWRDEETLRELYHDKGWGATTIAEELGCDKKTIYNWLDRHDIETRESTHDINRGWRDAELLEELYWDQDLSCKEIADKLDTREGTITKWLLRHDIETKDHSGSNHPFWRGGHDKYKGPNWRDQRQKARRRDQYRCQDCQKSASDMEQKPDVHHITPFCAFENYEEANKLDNLITLCRSCHITREHKINELQTP